MGWSYCVSKDALMQNGPLGIQPWKLLSLRQIPNVLLGESNLEGWGRGRKASKNVKGRGKGPAGRPCLSNRKNKRRDSALGPKRWRQIDTLWEVCPSPPALTASDLEGMSAPPDAWGWQLPDQFCLTGLSHFNTLLNPLAKHELEISADGLTWLWASPVGPEGERLSPEKATCWAPVSACLLGAGISKDGYLSKQFTQQHLHLMFWEAVDLHR